MSTAKQGEGVSLQEQKDAIQVFASRQGLQVIKWFEEKQTAAKSGRPVFNQMLRELKRGKASGMIMHKIDRSARNLKDWAIVSELPDQGIQVYIATESLDFNSRGGRLTADMLAVIAADYIRNLREETKKGIRGRLKQGLYPFRAPIGYLDNGGGKPKTPDPVNAPLIKEMFELYASGQHSMRSLRVEMNQRGLRNNYEKPLSLCGVETILGNPFYTGLIEIKRSGETYNGTHEPIISTSLFRRVQDIKSGRGSPKVTKHNHLFRGLFRCGLCNLPMTPELQKGHVYYRCHDNECETKTIREDALEKSILIALSQLEISNTDAEKLTKAWADSSTQVPREDMRKSLQMRIDATEQGLSRAADLLIAGTLDNETYLAKKREATLTLASLHEEIQKLPDPTQIEANNTQFIELMKNLAGLYYSLKPDEKRVLLKNTFSNRTVVGKEPKLQPSKWVTQVHNSLSVFAGPPTPYKHRTSELPKELQIMFRLMSGETAHDIEDVD